MKRVAQLLQQHDLRQALVRLWVLGSNGPRLNTWEQTRSTDEALESERQQFLTDIQSQVTPSMDRIKAAPLALIRALDDYIAHTNSPYNTPARFDTETLARTEDGKGYWLAPVVLQARRNASLNRQACNLGAWFHRHVVLPTETAYGLRVHINISQSTVSEGFTKLWSDEQPALKVWIGHFNDAADVQWTRNDIGNWRTACVAPQDVRSASLLTAVASATEAGANIIVFPEFTLDMDHRQALVRHLYRNPTPSLFMVLAGSFHETEGHKAFNTAPLYSSDTGETLLTHRKLRIFGDFDHGAEQVDLGDSVHVLVTPIGCMTVLICKDFLDAHPSVESLLTEVPMDWVLVPSFGDEKTIRAHKERAKELSVVKTGTHTVVAQTLNTAVKPVQPPAECVRGFGHTAGCKEHEPQVGESGGLVTFPLIQQAPMPPKSARPSLMRIK
ncbi:MAG: hypothetical protein A3F78_08685 [Burkholderiales bacterium RIFCSPLOWO2_12_FULL_61_40]|nr:MAG: hypothetical protein A3F78_08685 [Burkholderiales bacterium RIFCSPLOWO2_12_FULL_61_40]